MKIKQHTNYVWELENFIPDSEIDYFLGMFEFYNPSVNDLFRNDARQNDTYEIDSYDDINNMGWKWVNAANRYYVTNNKWIFYNWDPNTVINDHSDRVVWQGRNIVRMYNENDTYHWHGDQSPENHAEFSYIIYLNDDFDGGRTLFLNDRIGVTPKKGSVLCFPVDHYHLHKGTRVKSGVKKILWNCVYRQEIQMSVNQPYLSAVNAPRSSKKCIW